MKITVSDYHIRHGAPMSERFCALAMAITFHAKGVAVVRDDGSVSLYEIYRKPGRKMQLFADPYKTLKLPPEAEAWRQAYDQTGKGQPITFDLPLEEAA